MENSITVKRIIAYIESKNTDGKYSEILNHLNEWVTKGKENQKTTKKLLKENQKAQNTENRASGINGAILIEDLCVLYGLIANERDDIIESTRPVLQKALDEGDHTARPIALMNDINSAIHEKEGAGDLLNRAKEFAAKNKI